MKFNSHPSLTGINAWAGQVMVNLEWETGMKSEMVEGRLCTYCGKTNCYCWMYLVCASVMQGLFWASLN